MKLHKSLIALALAFALTACATAAPSPAQGLVSANKLLASLEHGMSLYCERADRDADVCAMARKVDNDAFAAVMAANAAAAAAGNDPSEALANAQTALESLATVLQGIK